MTGPWSFDDLLFELTTVAATTALLLIVVDIWFARRESKNETKAQSRASPGTRPDDF